mmetsp:Transcript_18232/g.26439  ORF Transcript_18232/g.26439 Transcript_18232/m.26439 type:complete len:363 (-) Transcript_18232:861-1949(-)
MGSRGMRGLTFLYILCVGVLVASSFATEGTPAKASNGLVEHVIRKQDKVDDESTEADAKLMTPKEQYLTQAQEILSRFETIFISLLIPIGLIGSLFGIVLFKTFLVIAGFIGAGSMTYVGLVRATAGTAVAGWLPILFGILVGLIGAYIAFRLSIVGVFLIGSSLGVALGMILWTTRFYHKANPDNPLKVFKITASVLGLVTGVASLFFEKFLIVVAMAYSGSFATVYGVGHLLGKFPDMQHFRDHGVLTSAWVWLWFVWFVLQSSLGMFIQFRIVDRRIVDPTKPEEDEEAPIGGENSFYFGNSQGAVAEESDSAEDNEPWNNWGDDDDNPGDNSEQRAAAPLAQPPNRTIKSAGHIVKKD